TWWAACITSAASTVACACGRRRARSGDSAPPRWPPGGPTTSGPSANSCHFACFTLEWGATPLRLRLYNSVFEYRHDRVVLSVPVLLRPEADSPQWTGLLERGLPGEESSSTLRYRMIRVWQLPVEPLLAGGLGTLALAPISDVSQGRVRGVIRRMRERLGGPNAPRKAKDVMAAAYVLLGLRYSDEFADALFEEGLGMEESTTYPAIVRRGRAEQARHILLLQGEAKFGPPDPATLSAIEAVSDLVRLDDLSVRLLEVDSWQELLASPAARRRNGRRRSRD